MLCILLLCISPNEVTISQITTNQLTHTEPPFEALGGQGLCLDGNSAFVSCTQSISELRRSNISIHTEYQTSGLRHNTPRYHVFQSWYLAAEWDPKGCVLAEQWEWNIEFGPITNLTPPPHYR